MNPKSLANLEKKKFRKEGHGYRYAIGQDRIDALFTKLVEGLSLKKAASQAGMHFVTARKYFESGDPHRGIQPLKSRLIVYQKRLNERFDTLLLERRQQLIELVVGAISKISGQLEAGIILKDPTIAELDRLIRLELFLRQGNQIHESQSLLIAEDIRSLAASDQSAERLLPNPESGIPDQTGGK